MNAAYTDLKPAWHLGRIRDLRETGHAVPAQIQLIISDLCNHDCSFCAYRMTGYSSNQHFADEQGNKNPRRFISYEKCIEILSDAAEMGVEAAQFTGGGEPTVHPHHIQIFEHALSRGLSCGLVTNGCLLRDGWESVLPRFSWVRVSLDAGTAETYAKIRRVRPAMFERALENIGQLAEQIAMRGTSCHLGTSFIITKDNWQNIPEAAMEAKAAGAHSIRYAAMFSPAMADYYSPQMRSDVETLLQRAKDTAGPLFKVIDMFSQRVGDLEQGSPDYDFCGYQHFNVYIGGDLNVYRCCNTAYNDLGLVGSLKDQRFKDYWNSTQKQMAYGGFSAKACAHCAFNGKNKLIGYLTGEKPKHVEFV